MKAPHSTVPFAMPMFRAFVPRRLQPWIYVCIAVTFQLSGGLYLGTLSQMMGETALMREDLPENVLPIPLETLDGRGVEIYEESDVSARRQKITEIVKKLVEQEGVNPSDIAVLSPYKAGNKDNSFPKTDARIRLSTIRSFKGLEADYVILTDTAPQNTENQDSVQSFEDFYVAASRAKYALYVLPAPGGRQQLEIWLQEARKLDSCAAETELRG